MPKVINLPEQDDMLRRLMEVVDDPDIRQFFYPQLLSGAGRRLNAWGVVLWLDLSILMTQMDHPFIGAMLGMMRKDFLDALVDDEEAKTEAFEFMDEIEARRLQEEGDNRSPTATR